MAEARRVIAVSGLGSIARQHIAAFRGLGGLDIVAFDPSESLRAAAVDDGSIDRAFADFEELLDAAPHALVIAAPDFAHLSQLQLATDRGITTLVEKPLAEDYAAALAVVPRVEATGVPALVGYVLRHRRAVEAARDLILDGAIGTPTSFQVMLGARGTITAAASRFAVPEKDRLYRDYSHEWDYLRWIFGPLREVIAQARTTSADDHSESPTIVDGLIAMSSGVTGAFHIDYVEPRGTRTLHVVGSGGTLFADIARGTVEVRAAGEEGTRQYSYAEPAATPLARQAAHLLAVAEGRQEPRVTLRDGLAALAATDALIRSAQTRTWTAVTA